MLCIVQCASIMLFFVVVVVFMCEWHAVVTTQSSALSFAGSLSLSKKCHQTIYIIQVLVIRE